MSLSALYQIFLKCQLVTTDSRNCPDGSLFIALKGESFNGNAFAGKALESGCAYAMVDEKEHAVDGDQRYILVDDCLQTMQQLANYHRRQLGTRVIGITGTNGKTTTKELIAAVLMQKHNVLFTQGNLNNHIGVPATLLRLKEEHDLAVIEMGANHPEEIKFLCGIAEPDYGIITNVGKAHLEGFGSFEGVIKTKGELYDFLRQKKDSLCKKDSSLSESEDSCIFIHHDNPYLMNIAGGLKQIPYGTKGDLYVNGRITGNSPYLAFEWKAGKDGELHRIQTQLIGEYNFSNALAAVAIGRFFGVEAEEINEALAGYTPQNNRSQLQQTEDNTLIIDAYNANPTSMMAALQNFRNMTVPNKMLLLGDMRELGAESLSEHQKIADYIEESGFDEVWLVGEQFASVSHPFKTYSDVQEVIKELKSDKPKGYTILIKGSNGIKLSTAVEYL